MFYAKAVLEIQTNHLNSSWGFSLEVLPRLQPSSSTYLRLSMRLECPPPQGGPVLPCSATPLWKVQWGKPLSFHSAFEWGSTLLPVWWLRKPISSLSAVPCALYQVLIFWWGNVPALRTSHFDRWWVNIITLLWNLLIMMEMKYL